MLVTLLRQLWPLMFGPLLAPYLRWVNLFCCGIICANLVIWILTQITSGKLPYFKYKHDVRIYKAISNGEHPGYYTDFNGEYDLEFWSILETCWSPDPSKRPSIDEVSEKHPNFLSTRHSSATITALLTLTLKFRESVFTWLQNIYRGGSYQKESQLLKNLEDIDWIVKFLDQVVSLTPRGHKDLAMSLESLGMARQLQFEHTKNLGDIDKAIEHFTAAALLMSNNYPAAPSKSTNLDNARIRRLKHLGSLAKVGAGTEHDKPAFSSIQELANLSVFPGAIPPQNRSGLGLDFAKLRKLVFPSRGADTPVIHPKPSFPRRKLLDYTDWLVQRDPLGKGGLATVRL